MNVRVSTILGLGAALAVASCSTAPVQQTRSPRAAEQLASALAGRVPGRPLSCIPTYRADNMQVINDWTILFRDGGTVYVQNPRGGCPGLERGSTVLVSRIHGGTQLCSGDIQQLVDSSTRVTRGSCVFGPFLPYTRR
jgi:hypothetical protein